MFIRFWFLWMVIGIVAAVWLFAWAIRTRQFSEGRRAALIPFDKAPGGEPPPASGGWGVRALALVLAAAVLLTLGMLVVAHWPNRPDRSPARANGGRDTPVPEADQKSSGR